MTDGTPARGYADLKRLVKERGLLEDKQVHRVVFHGPRTPGAASTRSASRSCSLPSTSPGKR